MRIKDLVDLLSNFDEQLEVMINVGSDYFPFNELKEVEYENGKFLALFYSIKKREKKNIEIIYFNGYYWEIEYPTYWKIVEAQSGYGAAHKVIEMINEAIKSGEMRKVKKARLFDDFENIR